MVEGGTAVLISVSPEAKPEPPKQMKPGQLSTVLPKWWRLCSLWFTGEERWRARGFSAAVITLSVITTLFMLKISYAQRNFSTAMSSKDVPGFYKAVWDFVLIIAVAAPLFSFNSWVEDRLVLAWRAYMTRYFLAAYFDNRAYFHLRQQGDDGDGLMIDNPDQRICDDVAAFTRSSVLITLSLVKKLLNCIAFAGVLWSVSSNLVVFMIVYALVGTVVTTAVFGKVLTKLYYKILSCEGDLRFSMVRVREFAESIAFYSGERQERQVVGNRLQQVVNVTVDRVRWNAIYDLWTSIYNYATILVPSLLTAPRYFRGEIEFGVISQVSFAFSTIESALSVIINNLTQLSGLAAETERLEALQKAMEAADESERHAEALSGSRTPPDSSSPDGEKKDATLLSSALAPSLNRISRKMGPTQVGLVMEGLSVRMPRSLTTIWSDLNLSVQPGESLLVVGASGCGKSSLLRVLAGLWSEGCGTIRMPSENCLFFLPQKPFMPLGNLRMQLLFPSGSQHLDQVTPLTPHKSSRDSQVKRRHTAASTSSETELLPLVDSAGIDRGEDGLGGLGGSGVGLRASDRELASMLDDVCLPKLLEKVGSFDAVLDWSHVLSSGEQQRVAMLRLLLHTPKLAFLDEATSAIDVVAEAKLYSILQKTTPTYVSVGHRMQLLKYHTHVLEHLGGGTWAKWTSDEYKGRVADINML